MRLTITYLGHSGVLLSDGSVTVAIDPLITENPLAPVSLDEVKCDAIVQTHGHPDHMTDTEQIAKANGATVFGSWEIHLYLSERGVQTEPGNQGGKIATDWGWVAFTQTHHSSSFNGQYMGASLGTVVNLGGITVYHLGDTGLFSDLKLLGEIYKPEIAFVPIGDRFTMGPELATIAAEFINPKYVVPVHYKTWPLLVQDASGFVPKGVEVKELTPGEPWSYQ